MQSYTEDILNKLDMKANPMKFGSQQQKPLEESKSSTRFGGSSAGAVRKLQKAVSKPELYAIVDPVAQQAAISIGHRLL